MKRKLLSSLLLYCLCFTCLAGCGKDNLKDENSKQHATMTIIGHASIMLKTTKGTIIYIDPYADGNYDEVADVVLVTHDHYDHNQTNMVTKKDTTQVITSNKALVNGEYKEFTYEDVTIEAVPAENSNHPRAYCVGYIITFDNISVYHSGDTNMIDDMKNLCDKNITYALYPTDGQYNMGPEEATEVANLVNAKHSVAIHTSCSNTNKVTYNTNIVSRFTPKSKLEIPYGTTIDLEA